jgi:hypothetical protein
MTEKTEEGQGRGAMPSLLAPVRRIWLAYRPMLPGVRLARVETANQRHTHWRPHRPRGVECVFERREGEAVKECSGDDDHG